MSLTPEEQDRRDRIAAIRAILDLQDDAILGGVELPPGTSIKIDSDGDKFKWVVTVCGVKESSPQSYSTPEDAIQDARSYWKHRLQVLVDRDHPNASNTTEP